MIAAVALLVWLVGLLASSLPRWGHTGGIQFLHYSSLLLLLASAGSLAGAAVQATKKRPGWFKRALLWLVPAVATAALGGLASFGAGVAQAHVTKPVVGVRRILYSA